MGNRAGDRMVIISRDLAPKPSGVDVFSAPAGSPFGPPSRIRGPGVPSFIANAAVGPDGSAAIAGVPIALPPNDPRRVMALVRLPGGSFTGPVAISGDGANDPHVAFDAQGNAMATWARDATNGVESYIEQSTRPPGGEWSAPTVIAREHRYSYGPQVAFDAAGGAVVVWTRESVEGDAAHADFPGQVVAALRPAGGDFGRPRVVSQPRLDAGAASFSVDPQGRTALVWVSNTHGDRHFRVGAAFRKPGRDRFGKPRFLTRARADGVGPSVALDARGRGLITWLEPRGDEDKGINTFQVRAAFRARSGRIGRPRMLSGPRADFSRLAMNSHGSAVVSWVYHGHRGDVVQARHITTRGKIGRLTRLTSRDGFDDLETVIAENGIATFSWTRYMKHSDQLEALTVKLR